MKSSKPLSYFQAMIKFGPRTIDLQHTNLTETFKRVRREQKELAEAQQNVVPIKREKKA